jgi:hypothetical protein
MFFKLDENSTLVRVTDLSDLDRVNFTYGLLQESDCLGSGRK